ncbi:MAG: hypothetical protein HYU36_20270 [Planctomycetes bacterium]|nr:hypothetical protein [Planctomycetota bacterium]
MLCFLGVCTAAILVGAGCGSSSRAFVRRVVNVRASDFQKLFKNEVPIRVGEKVVRRPAEQVLTEERQVCGYVQEELYPVQGEYPAQGEEGSPEARLYVVFDARWRRRGFITEEGTAYRYEREGDLAALSESGFLESVRGILRVRGSIALEPYQVPADAKAGQKAIR